MKVSHQRCSGLYDIDYIDNSRTASVRIFDFATQRLSDIILPFSKAPEDAPLPIAATASHDGRRLYVVAPTRAEVVIVDLAARSVEHVFPLDLGGYAFHWTLDWGVPLLPDTQALQLSPDGLRLYAVGLPVDGESGSAGIWVIDTAVWRIVDHWLPQRPIWSLMLDGDRLFALETSYRRNRQLAEPRRLHLLDAITGRPLARDRRYDELWSAPVSLAALYRQQYGRSPASAGAPPDDPRPLVAAPARLEVELLEVDAERGQALIEVRFMRPDTGAPVRPQDQYIRYTPPLDLRLTFTNGAGPPQLVIPGQVEFGVYRGVARLSPGTAWDVQVSYTDNAGLWRRLWLPAFVTVEPATADDEATEAPAG